MSRIRTLGRGVKLGMKGVGKLSSVIFRMSRKSKSSKGWIAMAASKGGAGMRSLRSAAGHTPQALASMAKSNPGLFKRLAIEASLLGGFVVLESMFDSSPNPKDLAQDVLGQVMRRDPDHTWDLPDKLEDLKQDEVLAELFNYATLSVRHAAMVAQVLGYNGIRLPDMGLKAAARLTPAGEDSSAIEVIDSYLIAVQDDVGDEDPLTATSATTPEESLDRVAILQRAAAIVGGVEQLKALQVALLVLEEGDYEHYYALRRVVG